MRTHEKGRAFKGMAAGKYYNAFAKIFGMRSHFYKKALGKIHLKSGMIAADLGCGTGLFTKALAKASDSDVKITGIDLSEEQIAHAQKTVSIQYPNIDFQIGSMDELPFEDNSMDLIATSMAVHEVPKQLRLKMLDEVTRVLKNEGLFLFVDIAKPKLGLSGLFWAIPMYLMPRMKDNIQNIYAGLLRKKGFILLEDCYLNSITRRQLFVKKQQ